MQNNLKNIRQNLETYYRINEQEAVQHLANAARLTASEQQQVQDKAVEWIERVREARLKSSGLDAFLSQYDLSSEEGVVLMCLAESLLRIPDKETANKLIEDKLTFANWQAHAGKSHSTFVNAGTYGLMLTGKILRASETENWTAVFKGLAKKVSGPLIREAMLTAMKILGQQFVMGETIEDALKRAVKVEKQGYRHSYDMLGEAAKTEEDAARYFEAYLQAIAAIGQANVGRGPIEGAGISVKLSALHPRYEALKREQVLSELLPRLKQLVAAAASVNINMTLDAEESDRLMLSLDLMEAVMADSAFKSWQGFGLAIQAYQKRAPFVIEYVAALARKYSRKLMVRLVKGAYWDSEIKWAQERGLSDYPVFTRKVATDVSYLACAKKLFEFSDVIYPQFATHNAYSAAAILAYANGSKAFEFQCLHGMGAPLYDAVLKDKHVGVACRVYAPVGGYENLLAYLVRRLLENGANTSFVNRILERHVPASRLASDPIAAWEALAVKSHPHVIPPALLFGAARANSQGVDFSHAPEVTALIADIEKACAQPFKVSGTLGAAHDAVVETKCNPSDLNEVIAEVSLTTAEQVEAALTKAKAAYDDWSRQSVEKRASLLYRAADLLQQQRALFLGLLVKEGGKTLPDAVAELREAIDYCHYYGNLAVQALNPRVLPGPTGEENTLHFVGRGVVACISPWNFPLAIFLGQVTAALVAGNTVIAKPASQTPVIAIKAIGLLHEAGIPQDVVQVLPGKASVVGEGLIKDERIAAVMLTGGTDTARHINRTLANREGSIVPLIAETGGQNAMIVDSSALPEQVVNDVLLSSFTSAGQRCSALRVLFIQKDVAPRMINMLKGAMASLQMGPALQLATDVGPVIDANAKQDLESHIEWLDQNATLLGRVNLPANPTKGHYFAPSLYQINHISQLTKENFGPILHVIEFAGSDLAKVIQDINQTGYGLTLGVQSRIDTTVEMIRSLACVGNLYVNRSQIGAVVGSQPFGGEGLSGTGPKAGGPHYLSRLVHERTFTVNTTAAGGNASLMSIGE